MIPRPAVRSPRPFDLPRARRRSAFRLARLLSFAVLLAPGPARADVRNVAVTPPKPTVCDSVMLSVMGALPDDCHTVRGMRVSEPVLLPTAGPLPTYRIRARVIVEDPNPMLGRACVLVTQPYEETAPLGRLRFGIYQVEATEYRYPYPADSTAPIDSSRVTYSFEVAPDTCRVGAGCVLLGFAGPNPIATRLDGCTVRIAPGDRFCFDVTLENPIPVGGIQTEITVGLPRADVGVLDGFDPVSVTSTARTSGFDVSWVAHDSTAKVVLFSPSGAAIPPGRGAVLHVCYRSNPATKPLRYEIAFGPTVIAAPDGGTIESCPTFARIVGSVCVGEPACDVNGDGLGDIRDILRIVRCALTPPGDVRDACPDSIRARADCNDDGVVDVRDVICCVRKILMAGRWGGSPEPGSTPPDAAPRIGFEGDVRWVTSLEGTATILIEPGTSFGGAQWLLDPGPAARIRNVALADPNGSYALDWWVDPQTGGARVVVYDREAAAAGTAPSAGSGAGGVVPVRISLEPTPEAAGGGELAIRSWASAARDGDALLETIPLKTEAAIPSNAVSGAPAVLPARPNPFVSTTEIAFSLPKAASVSLRLYDVSGRVVRTLAHGPMASGVHRVSWDGRDTRGRSVGSGVYFVRYEALGMVRTQRLLRLR